MVEVFSDIEARLRAVRKHDAESVRSLRRAISAEIEALPPREVVRLAGALMRGGAPGSHLVACELVLHHPGALATLGALDLRRLGATMASWGEVDTFACYLAGRAWRAGQVSDGEILAWARSSDRWWRRAALVSTVPLNVQAQGGAGDAARTLSVCETLVDDRDPMVVKALSWALRALAVRDAAAVRRFLHRHEAALAPRVLREVRSKLETGRKEDRRTGTARRTR